MSVSSKNTFWPLLLSLLRVPRASLPSASGGQRDWEGSRRAALAGWTSVPLGKNRRSPYISQSFHCTRSLTATPSSPCSSHLVCFSSCGCVRSPAAFITTNGRKDRGLPPSLLPCVPRLVLRVCDGLGRLSWLPGKVIYSSLIFQQIQDRKWVEAEGRSPENRCLLHKGSPPGSQRQRIYSLGERKAAGGML